MGRSNTLHNQSELSRNRGKQREAKRVSADKMKQFIHSDSDTMDSDDESGNLTSGSSLTGKFDSAFWEDHDKPIYGCSFSPFVTDERPVFALAAANRITIYRCPTTGINMEQVYKDPDPTESFYSLTWLYDDQENNHLVAAGGDRGIIRIISPKKGSVISVLLGHGDSINELRTHPIHPTVFLSASKDYSVRIWNAAVESCLGIISGGDGHQDQVLSADFDLEGKRVLSCSMDHSIKVWSLEGQRFSNSNLYEHIENSVRVASSERANFKKRAHREMIRICYPSCSTADLHSNYVDCVRWYGDFVISKSCDETICISKFGHVNGEAKPRDTKAETNIVLLRSLDLNDCDIWFLRFAIDQQFEMVASGNKIGKVTVWPLGKPDSESMPLKLSHRKCKRTIRQVDFSPDGKILIAVSDDASIWRWNITRA